MKNNQAPLTTNGAGAWVKKDIFIMWFHILVSCIPAIIVGLLFDEWFEAMFYNYQTVAIMLILFGVAFVIIENRNQGKKSKVNTLAVLAFQ